MVSHATHRAENNNLCISHLRSRKCFPVIIQGTGSTPLLSN